MAIEPLGDLQQLALGLEGVESVEDDERCLSPDELRQMSEAARITLEGNSQLVHPKKGEYSWLQEYLRLKAHGFTWRIAAYIAWAATPKTKRWPQTQQELATQILGLTSDRAIGTWRQKNSNIDVIVSLLQSESMLSYRGEVLDALATVASMPIPKAFQDRRMYLKMTGDFQEHMDITVKQKEVDDLSDYSEAELAELTKGAIKGSNVD